MIVIIFLIFFLWISSSIILWTIKNGISPMPSSSKAKNVILEMVPQKMSGSIYELGSGWGTLAFALAKKFPEAKIEAFETSTVPYLYCKMRQWISQDENLKFHRKDFFKVPLNNANVVTCYLYSGAMQQLKVKFESELLANTVVISNTFAVPDWKPLRVVEIPDFYHTKVYQYSMNDIKK